YVNHGKSTKDLDLLHLPNMRRLKRDWAMSSLILAQVAVDTGRGPLTEARKRRAADPSMSESETSLLDEATRLVLELTPGRP
ncbi:hypothetical protein ABZ960_18540, partial [Streptomyces pseudovenezuelae]